MQEESGRCRKIKKLCCFEFKYELVRRSRRGLEDEREELSLFAIDGALITAVRAIRDVLTSLVVHPLITVTLVNLCRIRMNKLLASHYNCAA